MPGHTPATAANHSPALPMRAPHPSPSSMPFHLFPCAYWSIPLRLHPPSPRTGQSGCIVLSFLPVASTPRFKKPGQTTPTLLEVLGNPPFVFDSRPAATPFALYHGLPIRPPTDLVIIVCRLPGAGRRCEPCRLVVAICCEPCRLVVVVHCLPCADHCR